MEILYSDEKFEWKKFNGFMLWNALECIYLNKITNELEVLGFYQITNKKFLCEWLRVLKENRDDRLRSLVSENDIIPLSNQFYCWETLLIKRINNC